LTGGLGAAVASVVVSSDSLVPMRMLGVPREFAPTGSTAFLLEHFGLTATDIRAAAVSLARAHA
jgi:transketolase